ncbi:alanine racemase [Candidatus Chromulinivorax destructor]|uniref:Alanine racemase n=2 Tax=Candidatus Chromulinivorax destructor TaxID=2066483 RepID=A0A345ZC69_9BACT|nr:alanine racemase [Candidatus Chromulinivorax destructor]
MHISIKFFIGAGLFMESRHSIINLDALASNFLAIQDAVGSARVMAIVKANAYGHGLVACSRFLQHQGVTYFGVAFIQEAIELRLAGITVPILVLGGVMQEQIPLFLEYDIEIMASSIDKLIAIDACATKYGKKACVHLKIDTGLGRIGVRYTNAEQFFLTAISLPWIEIVGVASHFATADSCAPQDVAYMREQCSRFKQATEFFTRHGLPMPLRHIANSGAIMQLPESYFDIVRPGIMLYGVYPSSWMSKYMPLQPVLSLYARIVFFKVLLKDQALSYGLTWRTDKDTRVVTLPVGYGDGYPRSLSNKGHVLMQGIKHPIIGNICMDQMMINIGNHQAYCGDEVVLIGTSGDQEITINSLVDLYGGSPYEFLVLLNSRISKQYIESTDHALQFIYRKEKTYEHTSL